MSQRTVHVILTTHWDREWVQSFEQYRFRLVNLMERLLAVLAAEPSLRFVFDGQTIVLEDYLALRPEHRERLRALAQAGRLVFGPWYVLADQFLEGDEATVRNLLIGRALAREMGGAMPEGYNPDSFGSIATMPMILNGFGITSSNLGRGVLSRERNQHCFRWAWRDGSEVLALDLGYGTAMSLTWNRVWNATAWNLPSVDPERAAADAFLSQEVARFPTAQLYASVGADHLEPHAGLEAQLTALTAHTPGTRWISSTPADFMRDSLRDLGGSTATLERVVGEMRGDLRAPMHLQGVLSTDTSLKQASRRCEILLTRVLEPLEVMCRAAGATSQRHVLTRAWKQLVACHPHDSICACSTDATMQDIHARVRQVEDLALIAAERWLRDRLPQRPQRAGDHCAIVVFNGITQRGSGAIDGLVRIQGRLAPGQRWLSDASGAVVGELEVLGERAIDIETFYATDADCLRVRSKSPAADQEVYTMARIHATVDFGTASGVQVLAVVAHAEPPAISHPVRATATSLDNGIIGLAIATDGRMTLTDHRSGKTFSALGSFEDMADIGDTYDYGALAGDLPLRSHQDATVTTRVLAAGPLRATLEVETLWRLPRRLADGTSRRERRAPSFRWPQAIDGSRSSQLETVRILSTVTVSAGSERVAVRTTIDNRCDHHRLRVAFASPDRPALASGGHFAVLERDWSAAEDAFPCRPMLDWIHRGDGLGILVKGLFEWEPRKVGAGGEILVTMLRSTDTIGPAAGANYDVEHARALGACTVEYAVIPSNSAADTAHAALAYTTPVLSAGLVHGGDERPWSRLPVHLIDPGDQALMFSACKRSDDDRGAVVRFWNPGNRSARVQLASSLGSVGQAVRLDESPMPRTVADTGLSLEVPAFGTGTLLIADRPS